MNRAVCLRCVFRGEYVEELTSHHPQGLDEGMAVAAPEVSQPRALLTNRFHHPCEGGARLGAAEQEYLSDGFGGDAGNGRHGDDALVVACH